MPAPRVADGDELSGWIVIVDEVVAARHRLVDGVVDELVDEVVETARAGRADVHSRAQPDRLEPLQNGDVFCGIASVVMLIHKKALQIRAFAGRDTVYQNARSAGGLREARGGRSARPAPGALRRSIAAASSPAGADAPRGPGRVRVRPRAAHRGAGGSGTGPGAKRSAGGASSPSAARSRSSDARRASRPSSKAQVDEIVATCSVPSRASRCGQALAAIASPTAAGQAADDRRQRASAPGCPPAAASGATLVARCAPSGGQPSTSPG